jgi:hypothetical protein
LAEETNEHFDITEGQMEVKNILINALTTILNSKNPRVYTPRFIDPVFDGLTHLFYRLYCELPTMRKKELVSEHNIPSIRFKEIILLKLETKEYFFYLIMEALLVHLKRIKDIEEPPLWILHFILPMTAHIMGFKSIHCLEPTKADKKKLQKFEPENLTGFSRILQSHHAPYHHTARDLLIVITKYQNNSSRHNFRWYDLEYLFSKPYDNDLVVMNRSTTPYGNSLQRI